jgi:hypothetical protein
LEMNAPSMAVVISGLAWRARSAWSSARSMAGLKQSRIQHALTIASS